jgi:hypothetical protein
MSHPWHYAILLPVAMVLLAVARIWLAMWMKKRR